MIRVNRQFSHTIMYALFYILPICYSQSPRHTFYDKYNTMQQIIQNRSKSLIPQVSASHILIYIMFHDDSSAKHAREYHKLYPTFTMPVYIRTTKYFETIMYRDILPFHYNEWKVLLVFYSMFCVTEILNRTGLTSVWSPTKWVDIWELC